MNVPGRTAAKVSEARDAIEDAQSVLGTSGPSVELDLVVNVGRVLSENWGASGPKVVWRKQVGQGFAGPAVVQGRVLVFHRVGHEEVLESLDAAVTQRRRRDATVAA